MNKDVQGMMSMRLSRVLADIGVNRYMMDRRRWTWLMRESMETINNRIYFRNSTYYHFGSQTEGTTTNGMKSDIDTLACMNNFPVILDWSDWKQGRQQLLVVRTDETPPQQCWLQRLRSDLPLPSALVVLPSDVIDSEGRVLMTNTLIEFQERFGSPRNDLVQHGPSRSWDEKLDLVIAYHCSRLPGECQFLFHRPRPGHWPRPCTLAKARRTGVFLVPQGYSDSPSRPSRCHSTALNVTQDNHYYPQSRWEWRFSTSMMERLLVFDMNILQRKTYVFIKILRKTFLKPIVGDRLSTFHIKTAMLFTIETYPPTIWREDNLITCVIYCLATLRRWLRINYCPHYTISGVNLFPGKLFRFELQILANKILKMSSENFGCIFQIQIDNLSRRMSSIGGHLQRCKNRKLVHEETNLSLSEIFMCSLHDILVSETGEIDSSCLQIVNKLRVLHDTPIEQEVVSLIKPFLYGTLASLVASKCIYLGQPITEDTLTLYSMSLDSDLLSSRLKFASMLYCSGHYEAAANCLTYCEGLLGPAVWPYCGCMGRNHSRPGNAFFDIYLNSSTKDMLQIYSAVCVRFAHLEMCCIPEHLVYELFRTMSDDDRQERRPVYFYKWMDYAVIDCVPFIHYLQYLSYRQLNQHALKHAALQNLRKYVLEDSKGHGHCDTAFNVLGNCEELENRIDLAWNCYTTSLQKYPRNNAAKWHVARMLCNVVNNRL
ncbi:uncharacterized protein LOC128242290 [Mya arenaria]|uniref:uncharacterized protein LOC128242290 n=1 Tax=Mya arenaria TaxID=6604 RepID=UPI0022E9737F|nr:uncharacterized protein LOC128242290 [Mya arenaria]XP_052815343.1 uncharacterized protein LOC128242290 [Mya arenaria]XP_052815345.1 uncharacterized protein LOC128242290 [Mya arenaria]XP_052815346.1 uncharacterized protein LOC128242290 [Mya arenaria]